MDYVELGRTFSILDPDRARRLDDGVALGFLHHGASSWDDLLRLDRVVVLATAASGKTEEFRQRAAALSASGSLGIFTTVERVGAQGLEASLNVKERDALLRWQGGTGPGWFFLDSIDEARINHKDVEGALNRLAHDLGHAYRRARVIISCRGSVWAGKEDGALIDRALPVLPDPDEAMPSVDPDEALLARPQKAASPGRTDDARPGLTLVSMHPLDPAQRRTYLAARGVSDPEALEEALATNGLQRLATRPGDLNTLADYWIEHERLGGLTEMVEAGVVRRLDEQNPARRSRSPLSPEAARAGAERLAAALILDRNTDLTLAPDDTGDGTDPYAVLADWRPEAVDELLRRGLFEPSTFGRLRFFHRSAQEYLTATWFARLRPGLTARELGRIFLAEPFGIRTIPPSLRATAAWLAAEDEQLKAELSEREPRTLLADGDPRRLSISDRAAALRSYAIRHQAGDVPWNSPGRQGLWMVADEALAPVIEEVAREHDDAELHYELLGIVEDGELRGCREFVRRSALRTDGSSYNRILATRAMRKAEDSEGLALLACALLADPGPLDPRLGPYLVAELFPARLDVDELLSVVARTKPSRRYQTDGYGPEELLALYEACPGQAARARLVEGLVRLGTEPPLADEARVSRLHENLLSRCVPLALAAIGDGDGRPPSDSLVGLLVIIARVGSDGLDKPAELHAAVQARPRLKEALFWAEAAAHPAAEAPPSRLHDLSWRWALWSLSPADGAWLRDGLSRPLPNERLLALDALVRLARASDRPEEALDELARLVVGDGDLTASLHVTRRPPVETEEDQRWKSRAAEAKAARDEREKERDAGLFELRERVRTDPEALRDPGVLGRWPGPFPLVELTKWLQQRTQQGFREAARAHEQLAIAFGRPVAEAYRDGLRTMWRVTEPARPEVEDETRTVRWTTLLSLAGLGLEAGEPGWAARLGRHEAERAAAHACLSDQGAPEWLGDLLTAQPEASVPIALAEVRREWLCVQDHAPLLERMTRIVATGSLRDGLVAILTGRAPRLPSRLATAAVLVAQLHLTTRERSRLVRRTIGRLDAAEKAGRAEVVPVLLRLLLAADPEPGADRLVLHVEELLALGDAARAVQALRVPFSRGSGWAVDPRSIGPRRIGRMAELAERLPRSEPADTDDEDSSIDRDHPSRAFVPALAGIGGKAAFRQILELAAKPAFKDNARYLRQTAREVAEGMAERDAWPERAVARFELERLAPIYTGDDLFGLACDLLDEIRASFRQADMSSRAVVQAARDEDAVQQWLGERLEAMGRGRFKCHRELQVAEDKRPDLVLIAAGTQVEVAIEVKHADKDWTLPDLRHALRHQLGETYLLPANRRHGILVVTNHTPSRSWRGPAGPTVSFTQAMALLEAEAAGIDRNTAGRVRVAVRGIDTTRRREASPG